MTDEQVVAMMLHVAGLSLSDEETAALVKAYPKIKGMIDTLHSVDEARYGDMCLTFPADPAFVAWTE